MELFDRVCVYTKYGTANWKLILFFLVFTPFITRDIGYAYGFVFVSQRRSLLVAD